jgi:predicted nucleotidyltransferase
LGFIETDRSVYRNIYKTDQSVSIATKVTDMESKNIQIWTDEESAQPLNLRAQPESKHIQVLGELLEEAKNDPNALAYMVIGSVARGTHHERSDIDVITILRSHKPSWGINKMNVDGLDVDSLYMTQEVFTKSVDTVPYLLHTMVDAKLLYDREGAAEPLLRKIREYYDDNPEIEEEWTRYFDESKEVKAQTGCRASQNGRTIIDVWNELERRHSDGKTKRPFFNSFYMTNPRLFSLVKKIIVLKG